jgi:hypothetical protein
VWPIALGDLGVLKPAVEVGGELVIELRARFGSAAFNRRVSFIASGDESNDVFVSAVGPGAHAEPKTGLLNGPATQVSSLKCAGWQPPLSREPASAAHQARSSTTDLAME